MHAHTRALVQSLTKTSLSAIPHRPILTRLLTKLRERTPDRLSPLSPLGLQSDP
jgi:hypothetical protein